METNELIAIRVSIENTDGDNWKLLMDESDDKIYSPLTSVLNEYFLRTKFKGSYKLTPIDEDGNGKLYAIKIIEEDKTQPIKSTSKYSFYGENFKQGI
jgi:hypothetical protein